MRNTLSFTNESLLTYGSSNYKTIEKKLETNKKKSSFESKFNILVQNCGAMEYFCARI
jgi:hypothetical protein